MVYFIIGFIVGAMLMLVALAIAAIGKDDETRNKVHFYVARDKSGELFLYLKKPVRTSNTFIAYRGGIFMEVTENFSIYGLNPDDFKNLKWEDEPIEVFLNLED